MARPTYGGERRGLIMVGSSAGGEALLSVDRVEGEVVLNQNLVAVLLVVV
jgi:hypothetical protein